MKKIFPNFFLILLLIGVVLRFFDINWGAPFFFHPDERNIATSVSGLFFPDQLNPHFFAYGSLPIYSIYILGIIRNFFNSLFFSSKSPLFQVSFESAILIGRFLSAFLSSLLIYYIYDTSKIVGIKRLQFLPVVLTTFSVGLIQYAHFGTFEIWTTFFSLLLFKKSLDLFQKHTTHTTSFIGILLGVLLSIKISNLVLIFIPLSALLLSTHKKNLGDYLKTILIQSPIMITLKIAIFLFFSPFIIVDYYSFQSSVAYEGEVATGALHVFYTQGFQQTIPILFQLTHIYPFLVGIPFIIVFFFSLPFTIKQSFRKNSAIFLLLISFSVFFFSQAFLYAKWTRYMIPTLPFMILLSSLYLENLWQRKRKTATLISISLCFFSFFYSILFVYTVYIQQDTRISAFEFAHRNLQSKKVLSESYDLGIMPFNTLFTNISLFNFYDLENDPVLQQELAVILSGSDYIILPSQRIIKTRLSNPTIYPLGNKFYTSLLSEKLGFNKIYQTPCDVFCNILYNFGYVEETASVFDRPTLYIFTKK